MSVRPIQLWEMVFPKEQMNTCIATINAHTAATGNKNNWFPEHENKINWIRRFLKLKKIPSIPLDCKKRIVFNEDIEVAGIGIKEDETLPDGDEKL